MHASSGAVAPLVSLCPHLVAHGLNQPFALHLAQGEAQYQCVTCVVASIERRLADQESPAAVAKSVVFDRCDHTQQNSACNQCRDAAVTMLDQRWNQLLVTDRPASNRLRRVPKFWIPPQPKEPRAERQRPRTEEQRAADKIAKRHAALMHQRGFPETWALQTRHREMIVVVPNVGKRLKIPS